MTPSVADGGGDERVAELELAIRQMCDELGVPGDEYPAPVANAVQIAEDVLSDGAHRPQSVVDGGNEQSHADIVSDILDPLIERVEASTADAAEARSEATTLRKQLKRVEAKRDEYDAAASENARVGDLAVEEGKRQVAALTEQLADSYVAHLRAVTEDDDKERLPMLLSRVQAAEKRAEEAEAERGITRSDAVHIVRNVARRYGYAVGVHGSQVGDLDLMLVPWTEEATEPSEVIQGIAAALPGNLHGEAETKPHGRLGWCIWPPVLYGEDNWHLDVSVMPRLSSTEVERACACRWAGNTTGEEGPQHECPYHRDHRTSAESEVARLREAVRLLLASLRWDGMECIWTLEDEVAKETRVALGENPTPPGEKRCPRCESTRRWPRPRTLNDDATLHVYCPDDFHSPDDPLIERKAHASPEADEQVGGWPKLREDVRFYVKCAAHGDSPEAIANIILTRFGDYKAPASSSIPTEKVREVVEWARRAKGLTGDQRYEAGLSEAADRLSVLVEGTEDG